MRWGTDLQKVIDRGRSGRRASGKRKRMKNQDAETEFNIFPGKISVMVGGNADTKSRPINSYPTKLFLPMGVFLN